MSQPVTAFLCAMPMELAPLVRRLALQKRSDVGGLHLCSGDPGGRPVVATVIGIGPKLAAERTGALLDGVSVARVVVVGISGAPDGRTPIGTVIRPVTVVDGDSGSEFRPHPFGQEALQGTLWTSGALTTDPAAMAGLLEQGVVALDMETAAVARVCESRAVPWSVVRAISDRVGDGLVEQAVLDLTRPDGKPDIRAAASYILKRPSRLGGLVRLARDSQRAATAAAGAAAAQLRQT